MQEKDNVAFEQRRRVPLRIACSNCIEVLGKAMQNSAPVTPTPGRKERKRKKEERNNQIHEENVMKKKT